MKKILISFTCFVFFTAILAGVSAPPPPHDAHVSLSPAEATQGASDVNFYLWVENNATGNVLRIERVNFTINSNFAITGAATPPTNWIVEWNSQTINWTATEMAAQLSSREGEFFNFTTEVPSTAGVYFHKATTIDTGPDPVVRAVNTTVANAPPDIAVWTDKTEYTTGNAMYVGLNLSNPDGAINVGIYIWMDLPSGEKKWVVKKPNVLLPAEVEYSNPTWQAITLPSIPPGDYAWHAVLYGPAKSEIISESISLWTFAGTSTKSTGMKAFEKKLKKVYEDLDFLK